MLGVDTKPLEDYRHWMQFKPAFCESGLGVSRACNERRRECASQYQEFSGEAAGQG